MAAFSVSLAGIANPESPIPTVYPPKSPFPPSTLPRQFGLPHAQSKGVMWRS